MDNSQLKADNSNNPDVIASVKAVSSTAPPSVAQYSSAQTTYPIEDLEVHEQGVVAQAQSSAHKANTNLLAFSRRKAMIVSIAIALIVTLFTGASILILVRKAPKSQQSGQSLIQTQDVALNDAEITDLPSELQSTNSSLLVNGDVITRGELKVSNGTYVTVIKVEDVTANQTYTLPNSSGVFCLSNNNCNFVRSNVLDLTNATLTDLQNQVNAPVVAAAASFVNNLNGAVLLQGTTNQVNVTTGNGTITISAPQDLAQLSSPTFAGLNINGNLALTGTLTLPLDCTTYLNGGSLSTDNTGQVVCQNDESSGAGASVTTIGGTAGTIAMFTAGAEIANSIITQLSGTITIAGDLQAIGVDSGAGLLQGTGGFTITGNIALGSASDAFAITSSGLDVTTAGAVSGVTTLDISGNFTQTGATTLTTGTGTISLNGPTTVASNQQFTALGMALFRDSTNSATAFQIQNASSVPVLTVGTTYDTYTNLIPNGTFEADTPGVDPVGWVRYKSTPLQAGDPEIDTESNPTYVHAGSRSMEVVTTTNSNDGAILTTNPLLSNTSYVLSMWIKADGISIINDLVLGYATYGGVFPFDCTISKSTAGGGFVATDWSQYTCSFNTPSDVTSGRIYVRRTNSVFGTGVTFYVDDVRLHRTVGSPIQLGQIGTAGTSALGQLQFAYDGGGRITLQPVIGSGLTQDYILTVPAESGVICTTSNASPCTTGADGRYLSKITNDSANVAVSANNYLYYLNNNSSAVASGVLRLENNTNTGEVLRVRSTIDSALNPDTLLVNALNSSTSRLKVFTSGKVAINPGSSLPSTDATFGDLSFGGGTGVIRTINVLASTASNTAGGSLVLAGGLGNGTQIGGTATLQGGAGGSSGIGGTAQILGGAAGASGNGAGGAVILTSGNGNGSGTGGTMSITAGLGGSTGSGGGLSIQGGAAGASGNGAGGAVGITAGTASGSGTGGSITLQATNGGGTGNSNGGSVIIRAGGLGSGSGTNGSIQIGNLNALGTTSTTQTIVIGGTGQTGPAFVATDPSSAPAITIGQYGGTSAATSVLNISAASATGNRQNFIFIGSGASNTSSGTNGGTVLTLGSNTSRSSVLIQGGNCNIATGGGICDVDGAGSGGIVEAIRLETDPIGDIRIGGSAQTGILSVGTGSGAGNRDVRIGSIANASTLLLQAGSGGGAGITLTTPTITVTNDTNFVLSGGVNGLSFNTNTLSVDATNGRIGIGNNAPTTALDVTGATNISLGLTVGGNLKAGNGVAAILNIAAQVVNTFTSSNCAFGCYGVYSAPTADNTVGGAGASLVGYTTSMATSNTAFTLGNAYGYFATNISRGAASTITSNYGVYVQNQTSGVSDYGVYIAGADTYALWVDAGATRLDGTLEVQGSTTLGDALSDTLTINGTAVSIPNSLNIDTDTLYVDATANNIGIGDATPLYALTVGNGDLFGVNSSGELLFEGTTADANELTIIVADPSADRTYTIPNSSAPTDTFCLVSLGNCAGSGGGVTETGTNVSGQVAYFTSDNNITSDADFLFDGTNVDVGGTLFAGTSDAFQVQATGKVQTINGTAASPAYSFTGAGDMGLYAVGADNLGISTVGVERIRVDSNGDVGIGISSSGPTLSVGGSIALNDEFFFAGQSATDYYINYTTGFELVQNSIQELLIDANTHRWGIADATPDAKFDIDATFNPATTGTTNNTGIGLTVSNTTNKSSGEDDTYGQQLSVTRTGASGGTINNYGSVITVTGDSGGTSLNTGLSVTVSGADTNYAALFQGGFVGVGDATPLYQLTVGNNDLFGVDSSGNVQFSDDAHTVGVLAETTANGAGNALSISAGNANGSTTGAVGGALNLNAGSAAGTGDNNGGAIVLEAGTATVAGTGGSISLTAGSAGTGGFGGVISLQTGANASSTYGAISMQASGGKVFIGNSNPLSSTGRLDLSLGSTSTAGLIVRGVASQTADFIQIRSLNSAGVTDGDILALTASGNLGIGDASPDAKLDVQQSGDTVAIFNRTADDGTIISLQQDGTEEGTISVSGNTISYNAFTGSHYANVSGSVSKGELVSYTGTNSYMHNNPQSEIIYGATKTVTENNPNVLGAYLSRQVPAKPYGVDNPYLVMAVGNGVMWVVDEGQDVSPGDYFISSSTAGHARKDPRTAPTSHIVGRAAESINWSTVSATIGGKKHALVSVTYEVFARDNNFIAGQSLQAQTASFESLQVTGMANISNLNVSGATQLAGLTVTGNTAIQGTLAVQGDTKVMSLYVGGKLISTGSAPSASLGGALTGVLGASISNDGTDTAGTVHINTGSQTIAQSGILAEVVFTSAYATPPKIVISGNNSQSAKSGAYVIRTATGFQIVIDDVPQQGTIYEFDYIIIETQNP